MEKLIIFSVAIGLLILIALFVLGYRSQSGSAPGLADGKLQPCPDSPNCVNSEYPLNAEHYIEPVVYSAHETEQISDRVKLIIQQMRGTVNTEESDYLAATFTSRIFGFVDDFEIRIDRAKNTIHVRSGSRIGHSDLGANRKRVENFKIAFRSKTGGS